MKFVDATKGTYYHDDFAVFTYDVLRHAKLMAFRKTFKNARLKGIRIQDVLPDAFTAQYTS
jgi:hypothetical protein